MIIRGNNIHNPLLLFLHGGPGFPNYPTLEDTKTNLEEHFTVCYWDQRGTGMSFGGESKGFKSVKQLVEDTGELTKFLYEKYSKDKIYLLGHSWGTIIGAKAAEAFPDYYYAYLAIGQLGVPTKVRGSKKSGYLQILNNIKNCRSNLWQRRYSYFQLSKDMVKCSALTPKEKLNILLGTLYSYTVLAHEIVKGNLDRLPFQLEVPVYFFIGKLDLPATATLGKEYIDRLKAPMKHVYHFDKSSHYPFLEEPKRFLTIIKKEVLCQ